MNFADRLNRSITKNKSVLVAGFDPNYESLPDIYQQLGTKAVSDEEACFVALSNFYIDALDALSGKVCAIKPNLAFFEQYGVGGLRAFKRVCEKARELDLLIIADAKRSDIDSSAQAYMRAFFGATRVGARAIKDFEVDAITVNPFLGFDSIEPFISGCRDYGKGIFVLVRTSNKGSQDLQLSEDKQRSASVKVAQYLASRAGELKGACGISSLGAVVGATHPQHARELRALMPQNLFLIPGFGAQGASAQDATAGFTAGKQGAVVNASRALMSNFAAKISTTEIKSVIAQRALDLSAQLNDALARSNN